ncbi:hypothetical protein CF335_g6125 [Tilletia laevis]|nr:hypothetical protein CF335_g6125 [Tilletia laevis]
MHLRPASSVAPASDTISMSAIPLQKVATLPTPSAGLIVFLSEPRMVPPESFTARTFLTAATKRAVPARQASTSARSAEEATTNAKSVLLETTKPSFLRAEGFAAVISELNLLHAFTLVVEDIVKGFGFGIPPLRTTTVQLNHATAEEDFAVLQEIVLKEMEVGRVVGPFSQEEVESKVGHFQTSPLGLVPIAETRRKVENDPRLLGGTMRLSP